MKEQLFSPTAPEISDGSPLYPGETTFNFFQRQSLAKFVSYREWIEELFQDHPIKHRNQFCRRLRDKNSSQFQSSLFEMQLYRMLNRLGLTVEIEPELPGTEQKIDFRVAKDRQSCFIEATVCGFGRGIFSDTDQEYDAILKLKKELPNPHLDIWLEAEGHLKRTLRKSEIEEIIRRIQRHLEFFSKEWFTQRGKRSQKINYWTVSTEGFQVTPDECKAEFKDNGNWTLRWTLALPPQGRAGQICLPGRSGSPDPIGPLQASLEKKAKHWSGMDLGQSLIVAVNNCHSEFEWDPDVTKCALGKEIGSTSRGSFYPELHRLSGVLLVGNACMGAERGAPIQLFRNGEKKIPDFLHFLEQEQNFGHLLGVS